MLLQTVEGIRLPSEAECVCAGFVEVAFAALRSRSFWSGVAWGWERLRLQG